MHHIYKTQGIILSDFNRGESNKVYYILTRDFGVLAVFAQGVRELKSKLKYALQCGSLATVDMVRGKEMWRITNAQFEEEMVDIENKRKMDVSMRILGLVRRLNHGEERNEKLFAVVRGALSLLKKEVFSAQELIALETIASLRILATLGYRTSAPDLQILLQQVLSKKLLSEFEAHKRAAIVEVKRCLVESQL